MCSYLKTLFTKSAVNTLQKQRLKYEIYQRGFMSNKFISMTVNIEVYTGSSEKDIISAINDEIYKSWDKLYKREEGKYGYKYWPRLISVDNEKYLGKNRIMPN